jgi:type II secretory pathway component PulF
MPVYSFEALSADGQSRKGVIEADSARHGLSCEHRRWCR